MSRNDDFNFFDTWWGQLIGSAAFIWIAAWLYGAITKLEAGGEGFEVNWIIGLIYEIAGKTVAVGVCALIAGLFFIGGIRRLFRTSQD